MITTPETKKFRLKGFLILLTAEFAIMILNLLTGFSNFLFYIGYFGLFFFMPMLWLTYIFFTTYAGAHLTGRRLWAYPLILATAHLPYMIFEVSVIYFPYYSLGETILITLSASAVKFVFYLAVLYLALWIFRAKFASHCTEEDFREKRIFNLKNPPSLFSFITLCAVVLYNLINEAINTYAFFDGYFGIYYIEDILYIIFTYLMIFLLAGAAMFVHKKLIRLFLGKPEGGDSL